MVLIEWMDVFSVGNEAMDRDHKALLGILNRIYEAWIAGDGSEDIRQVFSELFSYTESHFAREEVLLEKAGYPDLEKQKDDHVQLLHRLQEFQEMHLHGSTLSELSDEMVEFLRGWMINHILEEDMKYRRVLSTAHEGVH